MCIEPIFLGIYVFGSISTIEQTRKVCMGTIYIVSNNGKLTKRGESLVFLDYDGTQSTLPLHTVDQLFIMGTLEITGQTLRLLMKHSIETVFVSKNGKYDGKLVFEDAKNVFLRQRQYELLHDEQFCREFVRAVVKGKVKNQYLFMQRIARKVDGDSFIKSQIARIAEVMEKIDAAQTIDSLRGFEGFAATTYFSVLGKNIIQPWAVFKQRSKNPPRDAVNAVLSFLYTLLSYRIDALILAEGLDNAVGILHTLAYGRKSLVFDLMEEFRTPLVDTLVCALFNMAVVQVADFREVAASSEVREEVADIETESSDDGIPGEFEKAVLLTQDGLRKVVAQFERKLLEEHFYEPLGKRIEYKQILHEQVKMYKRFVMGMEEAYKPVAIV